MSFELDHVFYFVFWMEDFCFQFFNIQVLHYSGCFIWWTSLMLILLKESKTGYDSGVFYNQLSSANNHKCFYVSLLKILLKHKNFETLKTVKCPYCHTWEKYIGLSGSNFNLYNGKCQGEYNNSSSPPPSRPPSKQDTRKLLIIFIFTINMQFCIDDLLNIDV